MKKIPTIFERDWSGDRSLVVNEINPLHFGFLREEGIATRKIDGTSCRIKDGNYTVGVK